jgi:Tol biopolymer transport system component
MNLYAFSVTHFLSVLSREIVLGIIITWITVVSSFGQTQQPIVMSNIVDSTSKPEVFAPGVISLPFDESAATFMPDGNTVYFCQSTIVPTVCFAPKINGQWQTPEVVSFSGRWGDWDPFLSPDGKKLFFVSNRPLDSTTADKPSRKTHIWVADRMGDNKWTEPHYINAPFNLDGINNYAPTVSRLGTLCFFSPARDKDKKRKSYYVKWLGDHYSEPKELLLNGDGDVQDPCIAADESYVIFVNGNDLYVSFKQGDDWAAAQKLSAKVNNGDANYDPTISPDGKILYYSSNRVEGFYKRDRKSKPLNYEGLTKEMKSIFNGASNILMVPIHVPKS